MKCTNCNGTGSVYDEDHDTKDISEWEKLMGTECPECKGLGEV